MSEKLIESVTTILVAIIGVAIIAVLVSNSANTSGVVNSAGSAFAQDLGVAVSPITGSGSLGNFGFSGGAGMPTVY